MLNSPFNAISCIDYTVIFVRDMDAMRPFYQDVMRFSMSRELSPNWLEYEIGNNTFVLARPGHTAGEALPPKGNATVQLAFKVPIPVVDQCAETLKRHGVPLVAPPTDQDFGHRTLFFRDPDGNLLEIYAEI